MWFRNHIWPAFYGDRGEYWNNTVLLQKLHVVKSYLLFLNYVGSVHQDFPTGSIGSDHHLATTKGFHKHIFLLLLLSVGVSCPVVPSPVVHCSWMSLHSKSTQSPVLSLCVHVLPYRACSMPGKSITRLCYLLNLPNQRLGDECSIYISQHISNATISDYNWQKKAGFVI